MDFNFIWGRNWGEGGGQKMAKKSIIKLQCGLREVAKKAIEDCRDYNALQTLIFLFWFGLFLDGLFLLFFSFFFLSFISIWALKPRKVGVRV